MDELFGPIGSWSSLSSAGSGHVPSGNLQPLKKITSLSFRKLESLKASFQQQQQQQQWQSKQPWQRLLLPCALALAASSPARVPFALCVRGAAGAGYFLRENRSFRVVSASSHFARPHDGKATTAPNTTMRLTSGNFGTFGGAAALTDCKCCACWDIGCVKLFDLVHAIVC